MADLIQAISRAIILATRIRTISEKSRDAQFKGVVDSLLLELAELQLKLEALASENAALKGKVHALANPQGERCPRCQELGWKISGTRQDKNGRIVQLFSCPKCKLKEEVLVA